MILKSQHFPLSSFAQTLLSVFGFSFSILMCRIDGYSIQNERHKGRIGGCVCSIGSISEANHTDFGYDWRGHYRFVVDICRYMCDIGNVTVYVCYMERYYICVAYGSLLDMCAI